MGIAAKHAYRFGFLKSEKWESIRLESLVIHDAKCYICGHRSIFNDVHHALYRSKWSETKPSECFPLCRSCHNLMHAKVGCEFTWSTFRTAVKAILSERGTGSYGIKRIPKNEKKVSPPTQLKIKKPSVCSCCGIFNPTHQKTNIMARYGKVMLWDICEMCIPAINESIEWPESDFQVMALVRQFLTMHREIMLQCYG